jgi:hypothetical protein
MTKKLSMADQLDLIHSALADVAQALQEISEILESCTTTVGRRGDQDLLAIRTLPITE